MSIANTYPIFEPDQVLTNDHLNSMVNYLDQQDRLTRIKLVGCGIVCGLEITSDDEVIKISRGCAVTSQGFMICQPAKTYSHYRVYTAPVRPDDLQFIKQDDDTPASTIPFYGESFKEIFELIDSKELEVSTNEVFALNQAPDDFLDRYVVVLFLEAAELDLKNCDVNDCNDKGKKMNFEVKALLVEKGILDAIIKNQGGRPPKKSKAKIPLLKRYNVPVQTLNNSSDVLLAFRELSDNTTVSGIAEALQDCVIDYKFLLENVSDNVFDTVDNQLSVLREKIMKDHPVLIQYFYDYLDDIIKAWVEFTRKAQQVSSECCIDEMRFPLHIMLGEAAVNTTPFSQYRQYFIYSPLFNSQKDSQAEIRLLFNRLRLLISEFSLENMLGFEKKEIRITPSIYGKSFLSARCIPYYYEVADPGHELYRTWSFAKTKNGEEQLNLSYNASGYDAPFQVKNPLLYDIEPYNFFRIEGHIGKHVTDSLQDIKRKQQENNLPFEVLALSADSFSSLVKGEDPQCVIQDLESDYRVLIASFICHLHDVFCKVGHTELQRVAGTFTATLTTSTRRTTASARERAVPAEVSFTPEEEEEIRILATSLDKSFEAIVHPPLPTLISGFHLSKLYQKGETLSRLCKPGLNTIGASYINNIKKNSHFRNPFDINSSILGSALKNSFFELLDAIESMLEILMNNELSEIKMDPFKSAYNRYEMAVRNASKHLIKLNISIPVFLSTCIVEKLNALKSEYERRMAQYRLAKHFGHYFSRHGGVEHKAGVPKGGTFILVYHEESKGRTINIGSILGNKKLGLMLSKQFPEMLNLEATENELVLETKKIRAASEFNNPELFLRTTKTLTTLLDECKDMPKPQRDQLIAIINQPPGRPVFKLQNGTVIADFYVPYLCSSNCLPVAYILPALPTGPTISIDKTKFCKGDERAYEVYVRPAGGLLKMNDKPVEAEDGSFLIRPLKLPAKEYTLSYSVSTNTITVKFEVVEPPKLSFERKFPQDTYVHTGIVTIKMNSTASDTATYTFEFGDGNSKTLFNKKEVTHDYGIPSESSRSFQIKVTVIDGPCTVFATKDIKLTTPPIP